MNLTTDPRFQQTIRRWIEANGEILVLIRLHAGAGSREYEFFRSYAQFEARMKALPSRASVIAFRERQLPLRGKIDDAFIARALKLIPEGQPWLATALTPTVMGKVSWLENADGSTQAELRAELEGERGREYAVGLNPPWIEDSEVVVSAIVPDKGGSATKGSY